jgi:hypothetical protein
MVTHHPHPIASKGGLSSSAGDARAAGVRYATRAFWWLRQTYCGFFGHDALLQFNKDRIFLQCVSCGRESPGWELGKIARPIGVRGDGHRIGLRRPHLISQRRIA